MNARVNTWVYEEVSGWSQRLATDKIYVWPWRLGFSDLGGNGFGFGFLLKIRSASQCEKKEGWKYEGVIGFFVWVCLPFSL